MKILLISAEYSPEPCGGIGYFYRDLAERLARHGHGVTVVAPGVGHEGDDDVAHDIVRWPGSLQAASLAQLYWARARFTRFVRDVVDAVRPDLAETHEWSGPLLGELSCPLVVRLHGSHSVARRAMGAAPRRSIRHFEQRTLTSATEVVAVSRSIAEASASEFVEVRPHSPVIPNGIDTKLFRPCARSSDSLQLVFVGTRKAEKGYYRLLEALPTVVRRHPEVTVRVVGRACSAHVRALPDALQSHVSFDGFVPRERLPQIYTTATVCVLPSLTEAFGLTMAEAMSCGVPVVGSRLGAGRELAYHGEEAILVDPRNAKALAEGITRCLEDGELRRLLSTGARARALRCFSWDQVILQNERFYEGVRRRPTAWAYSA